MFRRLHAAYTDVVCNPFYIPGDNIVSKLVYSRINVLDIFLIKLDTCNKI